IKPCLADVAQTRELSAPIPFVQAAILPMRTTPFHTSQCHNNSVSISPTVANARQRTGYRRHARSKSF
ncbi:hypothetical protein, partial [Pseudomonas savastanoi]|uniref:hypothetical protein n=1 Tax=Pseudomonas savastanoi TaxID=29438 RepID=UPI001C7FC160